MLRAPVSTFIVSFTMMFLLAPAVHADGLVTPYQDCLRAAKSVGSHPSVSNMYSFNTDHRDRAIQACNDQFRQEISFEQCIGASQAMSNYNGNMDRGVRSCVDSFVAEISVERCVEGAKKASNERQYQDHAIQYCIEQNLPGLSVERCTNAALRLSTDGDHRALELKTCAEQAGRKPARLTSEDEREGAKQDTDLASESGARSWALSPQSLKAVR